MRHHGGSCDFMGLTSKKMSKKMSKWMSHGDHDAPDRSFFSLLHDMRIQVKGDLDIRMAKDLRQDLIILRALFDPAGGEGSPEGVAGEGIDPGLRADLFNVTVQGILPEDLPLRGREQKLGEDHILPGQCLQASGHRLHRGACRSGSSAYNS